LSFFEGFMTDTSAAKATLRAEFAKNAVLPRKQMAAAQKFIDQLNESMAQGVKPSAADLQAGQKLLKKIENQTEIFMFNAVILAGQDSKNDGELDRKLQAISDGIDQAETTSERLREVLETFA
jgi:hypothetical protein